jgi:retinol dehydrogenase-12
LAERLARINPNARVISLHPGVVRTELGRYAFKGFLGAFLTLLTPLLWLIAKSSWHGAQTTIYGVMEDKDKLVNGSYYADCKPTKAGTFAEDPLNRKRLWSKSEEMMNIKFNAD